jgi:phenylacetic acid degradation protein
VRKLENEVARIYEIDGVIPVIDPSAFVHPDAVLIGDVIVGPRCYVAPLASLRGDMGRIRLDEGANVQDGCVIHGFPGRDCIIEAEGHIGHGSVLHGCRIGAGALVGMSSVIMDGAEIGEGAFIAATSFVKAGFEVPPRMLAGGTPARILRALSEQELAWKANGTRIYQELAIRSRETLQPATPLSQPEPNRKRVNCAPGEATPLHELKEEDRS